MMVVHRREGEEQEGQVDPLASIAAPVLAGFSFAAVVVLKTTIHPRDSLFEAAAFTFTLAALALVFAVQMLAFQQFRKKKKVEPPVNLLGEQWVDPPVDPPKEQSAEPRQKWVELLQKITYEVGLLAVFAGLGIVIAAPPRSNFAYAGIGVVALAIVADVTITVASWWLNRTKSKADEP